MKAIRLLTRMHAVMVAAPAGCGMLHKIMVVRMIVQPFRDYQQPVEVRARLRTPSRRTTILPAPPRFEEHPATR